MAVRKKTIAQTEALPDGGVIHIHGRAFVLVPLEDYAELRARADNGGYTPEEDAEDLAAIAAYEAAKARGEDFSIPGHVVEAMIGGETPIAALRKWRGFTQKELAARAGLAQGYFSMIETGTRVASLEKLRAIAAALGVQVSLLIDD